MGIGGIRIIANNYWCAAAAILNEDALSTHKVVGIGLDFAGLIVVFGHGAELGTEFLYGILACLVGTVFHAIIAVAIKRIDAPVGGFSLTAGALSFAVPLLLIHWWIVDGVLPTEIRLRAGLSMIYLGVVASAIGFALYYFILKRMSVSKVSLIALITPVIALALGSIFNGERLTAAIMVGAGCIVSGLMVYEFGFVAAAQFRNHPLVARIMGLNQR